MTALVLAAAFSLSGICGEQEGDNPGLPSFKYLHGARKATDYRDARPNGIWTQRYGNGQKMAEGEYQDGEKPGKWTWWYENGMKVQ